ncbi:MAG: hypothetical protein ACJ79E_11575 [Anaeromyxobacteraceae bacterium]
MTASEHTVVALAAALAPARAAALCGRVAGEAAQALAREAAALAALPRGERLRALATTLARAAPPAAVTAAPRALHPLLGRVAAEWHARGSAVVREPSAPRTAVRPAPGAAAPSTRSSPATSGWPGVARLVDSPTP